MAEAEKEETKVVQVKPRKPSPRPKGKAHPWEMQPEETLLDFHYFRFYRDMQKRSIRVTANAFGLQSPRKLEKLSQKHKWGDRVRAWDQELDRRVRDRQVEEIAQMQERHINIGLGMQTAVVKELNAWVKLIEEAHEKAVAQGKKAHAPILNITELIKLSNHGTQLERLNRGEPTDHTRVDDGTGEVDLTALSKEQLQQLHAIKKALAGDD